MGYSSNIILNCNLVRLGVYMVKLCHEKMLILRCISPKKNRTSSRKNPTSHHLENLEHPDKKLNSLGIMLLPRENLKPLEKYQLSPSKKIPIYQKNITSAGPRYEGQLMSDGGVSYSPFRSILLVLTHDFIITCVYGPTGSDGHERKDADAALRTIFVPFGAKGVLGAPSS